MKQFSFGKNKKVVRRKDFKAVFAGKRRVSNGLLTLLMGRNDCGYARLGVSVAKGCGKAVVRNRLKRLVREAFRQSQDVIPAGFDYIVMVSPAWREKLSEPRPNKAIKLLGLEQVRSSFLSLVKKAAQKDGGMLK